MSEAIGQRIYEALHTYEERMAVQDLYGNYGEPDREFKMYKWIGKQKELHLTNVHSQTLSNLFYETDFLVEMGSAK